MIISELTYLEIPTESDSIQGGDFSASITDYINKASLVQTSSTSTPGGSSTNSMAMKSFTKTFGASIVVI